MTEEITIYNELTQSIACNTAYLHGLLVALGYNVKNDELLRLFAQKPFEIIRNNLKKHQETSDLLFKGLSETETKQWKDDYDIVQTSKKLSNQQSNGA
jgi:hypothetical protein